MRSTGSGLNGPRTLVKGGGTEHREAQLEESFIQCLEKLGSSNPSGAR